MSDLFDNPSSSTGITWDDYKGRLLLVTPNEYVEGIQTSIGTKDAIRADITVLDGPEGQYEISDTLIFPKVLISQVRKNVGTGRMNLGRLGQGEKKPGQSAPWKLTDPTDEDRAVAREYLTSNKVPF